MKIIFMSLVPGAIFATFLDYILPHLSSIGFVYAYIAGMVIFIVLTHTLNYLLGNKRQHRFKADSATFLRTKLY